MIKIESIGPCYSRGPSSRKFGEWKRKVVTIFEKELVLEQYWVQIIELHSLEESLSYWEDEKEKLGSEV